MPIKTFRRSSTSISRQSSRSRKPKRRGSSRSRGYDAEWDKLSVRYRRSVKGLCEECYRRGIIKTCDVVDHMIPVNQRPDLRLAWQNLDALCHSHHNGFKRRIEDFAIKSGQVEKLSMWMKFPKTRPIHFRFKESEVSIANDVAINFPSEGLVRSAKPVLVVPSREGVLVCPAPCTVMSISSFAEIPVELLDGGEVVYVLKEMGQVTHSLDFEESLSMRSNGDNEGKVSLSYVERSIG